MMNIGDLEPLISSLDFPYICRICLKRKYLKNFEEYQVLLQLFRNITDLGNDLEENLPKNVCFSCIQKLENILAFIECSKVNDSCLRQVLSNERVKQELFVDEPVCNFKTELISESDYDIKVNEKTPGFSKNVVEPAQGKNDTESRKNQSKTCSFCGECFSTQRGILSHIKLERACRKLFIAKNPGSNFCNNFTPQGSKCSICGKDFSSKALFIKHLKCLLGTKKANMQRKLCQKYFGHSENCRKKYPSKIVIERDPISASPNRKKPHPCNSCDKRFSTSSALKEHERCHTGFRPYLCSYCSKTFSRANHLTRHLRTHTGEKPYECAVCCKAFSQKGHMIDHFKSHTGVRSYHCKHCGKGFLRNSDLNKHLKIHSGERPFRCLICEKRFITNGQLATHRKVHSVVKTQRTFSCELCGKVFSHQSNMCRHRKKHKEEEEIQERIQYE